MNEPTQSIWKKSWKLPGMVLIWAILVVITAVISTVIIYFAGAPFGRIWTVSSLLLLSVIVATAVLGLYSFIRWLCCWKNFRLFLFAGACCSTLVALFYAEEDWRGWNAWNQFKQSWEAKGEHFDVASVTPPSVPDEQNFAMTPIACSSYGNLLTRDGKEIPYNRRDTNFVNRMSIPISSFLVDEPTNGAGDRVRGKFTDLAAWQAYYRALAAKTNEFSVPAQPQSPAADVLLALGKYDGVIEELRTASRLPASRFPLTYDNESPAAILLPHLAPLKVCSRTLQLRSAAELQAGMADEAMDDVVLGLQLAGKIRTEPFLISHLVRIAIVQIMLQSVWEGLAEHRWSDSQLAALDAELATLNFPADYQLGLRGELAMQNGELTRLRRHPGDLDSISGGFDDEGNRGPDLPGRPLAYLIPRGWFYQNQFHCARTTLKYYFPIAEVDHETFSPEMARNAHAVVEAEFKSPGPFNVLERMALPGLKNAAGRFAFGQASVDLARTAIALERYRLAHGGFPESPDSLSPQFIAKVPHDVIGGQPLKYRRTNDGQFVLYSIGWNETDDGGNTVFTKSSSTTEDLDQGDWVWEYPGK